MATARAASNTRIPRDKACVSLLRSCELAAHHRRASGRQLTRASALGAGGEAGPHARVMIE